MLVLEEISDSIGWYTFPEFQKYSPPITHISSFPTLSNTVFNELIPDEVSIVNKSPTP